MSISLTQMRSFIVLAKHLSFKRAALELDITSPALSGQIAALERSLGVQIVARTTRSTKLTPNGENFLRRSRRIISDIDSAVGELQNPAAPRQGRVSFACIPTIAAEIFPQIMREYQRKHPDVSIEIVDEETIAMERRIVNREVDFGVGGTPRRDGLTFKEVFADPFVLVCRGDDALARKSRVSFAEALKHPMISLAKESSVRQTINAYARSVGLVFDPAFEVIHHYTIGAMVEAGLGVTMLPSRATGLLRTSHQLTVVPFAEKQFARPVGLITRSDELIAGVAKEFVAFMIDSMHKMPPARPRAEIRKKKPAARS